MLVELTDGEIETIQKWYRAASKESVSLPDDEEGVKAVALLMRILGLETNFMDADELLPLNVEIDDPLQHSV